MQQRVHLFYRVFSAKTPKVLEWSTSLATLRESARKGTKTNPKGTPGLFPNRSHDSRHMWHRNLCAPPPPPQPITKTTTSKLA